MSNPGKYRRRGSELLIDDERGASAIAFQEVFVEYAAASAKHPKLNSHHEAYAVIKEELDEYWAEVMKKPSARNGFALRKELVQTAAMCLRALAELTNDYNTYRGPAKEKADG